MAAEKILEESLRQESASHEVYRSPAVMAPPRSSGDGSACTNESIESIMHLDRWMPFDRCRGFPMLAAMLLIVYEMQRDEGDQERYACPATSPIGRE